MSDERDHPLLAMPRDRRSQRELQRLVERQVLSAEQAEAVRRALRLSPGLGPDRARWAEIAGYVGGGLVLAGAVLLVGTSWGRLSEITRGSLVGTFTVILLGAGVIAAGGLSRLAHGQREVDTPRLRIAATLLALAAGTLAVTVVVSLSQRPDSAAVAIGGASGLVLSAIGYWLLPTVFGLVAAVTLEVVTALSAVSAVVRTTPLEAMIVLVVSGLVVAALAVGSVLRQRLVGLALGLGLAMVGMQQLLGQEPKWAYSSTFVFGAACLVLYRSWRSWVSLAFGVLGLTLAVPEAVWDLTGGQVGGAAIPLIGGVVLLVSSGLGLRVRRRGT